MRMHIATDKYGDSDLSESLTGDDLSGCQVDGVFGTGKKAANREALFVGGVVPKGYKVPADGEKNVAKNPPKGTMIWSDLDSKWIYHDAYWTESSIVPKGWTLEDEPQGTTGDKLIEPKDIKAGMTVTVHHWKTRRDKSYQGKTLKVVGVTLPYIWVELAYMQSAISLDTRECAFMQIPESFKKEDVDQETPPEKIALPLKWSYHPMVKSKDEDGVSWRLVAVIGTAHYEHGREYRLYRFSNSKKPSQFEEYRSPLDGHFKFEYAIFKLQKE